MYSSTAGFAPDGEARTPSYRYHQLICLNTSEHSQPSGISCPISTHSARAPRACRGMHFTGYPVDCLHKVVPQSPQKYEVTMLPESTGLLNCFGVPDSNFRELLSTKRLVLNMLPVTFRQSMQWHIAYRHHEHGQWMRCLSNQL